TARDRAAGDRLLERIAATPGDVLVPFHPYYPVRVGKPPFVHRMGVMDAPSAGFGRPRGLDQALADGRFALVIMDYKVVWGEWPTLLGRYRRTELLEPGVDAPRSFSGADTAPRFVLTPRPAGAEVVWAAEFASTPPATQRAARELVLAKPRLAFELSGSND